MPIRDRTGSLLDSDVGRIKLMKEMHQFAMATEQPLRDGLSAEEYNQLFELLEKARGLVASAT